jgi:uncharacterized protein
MIRKYPPTQARVPRRKAASDTEFSESGILTLLQVAYDAGIESGRTRALTETKAVLLARFAPPVYGFEIKAATGRTFSGFASTWDGPDHHGDVIEPGAYTRTIQHWSSATKKLRLLDQHRDDSVLRVLGHVKRMEEVRQGLYAEFQVVESQSGDELLARVKEGLIDSLSIGYSAKATRPTTSEEKSRGVRRVLTEVQLREISVVLEPANPYALISAA